MRFFGYRPGSLRETLAIAFPLMLASLSIYLMVFFERCVLARFSLDALNAAVQASSLSWAFWGGMTIMAGMADIFVSRSHIQGGSQTIGSTVWQTVWISLSAAIILVPVGLLVSHHLYPSGSAEEGYFRLSMMFGFLNPLVYSLTAFFVGRGKVKYILYLTIAIGAFNTALDYALIFGLGSYLPSFGAKGAAMASSISLSLQCGILLIVFLKKSNRLLYGTSNWKPCMSIIGNFIKASAFPAILYNVELWGWSLFYSMMASTGNVHITVSSLCQSLIYLFTFIAEGLCRGTTLQASVYFTSGQLRIVKMVLRSSGCILLFCFAVQIIFLTFSPHLFLRMFLSAEEQQAHLFPLIQVCTWLVLLYMLLQGFQWLLSGLLCAAGKTMPMTLCGLSCLFGTLLIPTYFFIEKSGHSVVWAWGLVVMYSLFCCLTYFYLLRRLHKQFSLSHAPQALPLPIAGYFSEQAAAQ